MCFFHLYWAGLLKGGDKTKLQEAVNQPLAIVTYLAGQMREAPAGANRALGAGDQAGVLCIADACGRSFSAPLNVVVLLSLVLSSALNSTVVVAGDTRFSCSERFDGDHSQRVSLSSLPLFSITNLLVL